MKGDNGSRNGPEWPNLSLKKKICIEEKILSIIKLTYYVSLMQG